ncbi:MAG TPA: IS21 family transposase [Polyangiaceae bacterium]|nr:IS21 family transposase [Polyangiaceae bacterium]
MNEFTKHGHVGRAAMLANMDRKTARKYLGEGKLPSEMKGAREYRTRVDPFEETWPWVEEQLKREPDLQAKTLFEELTRQRPERFDEGQLRTLQRRVRDWRAAHGPEREIFFPQQHRPGELSQMDFTHASELCVTIAGEAFAHLLCNFVLVFSNWQWVTVCLSESYLALKRGFQEAVMRLGHVPARNQTDNSTSATSGQPGKRRQFNQAYLELMAHYGVECCTTGVGKKEQNGDVEAGNGALKRRLDQALMLRASRDFESVESYEKWILEQVERWNQVRRKALAEELAVMRKVTVSQLPDYEEHRANVSQQSTVRVCHNAYSVPSRLIGHAVRVRVFERTLEVWHGERLELSTERLRGRSGHRIDYRHVIWSLVKKPGAFARYRYRSDLFPTLVFRRAYDRITEDGESTKRDLEYLRILFLAATTMQCDVQEALELLIEHGERITADAVKALVTPSAPSLPALRPYEPELASYNALLTQGGVS